MATEHSCRRMNKLFRASLLLTALVLIATALFVCDMLTSNELNTSSPLLQQLQLQPSLYRSLGIESTTSDTVANVIRCTPIFQEVQDEEDGGGSIHDEWQCVLPPTGPDAAHHLGRVKDLRGLNPEWLEQHVDQMMSGENELYIPGATVTDDDIVVPDSAGATAPPPFLIPKPFGFRTFAKSTVGIKKVLAVRVVANDAATTATVPELSDAIFGTDGDAVNLKTQMRACSFKKLKIKPFVGTAPNGYQVHNGVVEVTISENAIGANNNVIRQAALEALQGLVGDLPSPKFDHVMLCLPPGTASTWVAYAYQNEPLDWLSVYNNDWCLSPTATMHEISHNLLLGHAGQWSSNYGDTSGTMGSSSPNTDLPRKCFNGPKSWQLGWYADRQDTIFPLQSRWDGRLLGVVDYKRATHGDLVILRLEAGAVDYYVAFNRATGFNSGDGTPYSIEGGDKVMVTTQGDGSSQSSLESMLRVGEEFAIDNFNGSSETVIVKVNGINLSDTPAYANVSVYVKRGFSVPSPRSDVGGDSP